MRIKMPSSSKKSVCSFFDLLNKFVIDLLINPSFSISFLAFNNSLILLIEISKASFLISFIV